MAFPPSVLTCLQNLCAALEYGGQLIFLKSHVDEVLFVWISGERIFCRREAGRSFDGKLIEIVKSLSLSNGKRDRGKRDDENN